MQYSIDFSLINASTLANIINVMFSNALYVNYLVSYVNHMLWFMIVKQHNLMLLFIIYRI